MKKLPVIVAAIAVMSLTSGVYAVSSGTGTATGTGGSQGTNAQGQQGTVITPTAAKTKTQTTTQTKNAGTESQLMIQTQTQTGEGDGQEAMNGGEASAFAYQSMSGVSQIVDEMLETKSLQGGVGQQVKSLVQEQKTAQEQVQNELGRVDNRGGLLKTLIGPDYSALKLMEKLTVQNQLRIKQLEQLQNQLANAGDIAQVKEMIQGLVEQNGALQNKIATELKTRSIFGWLARFLAQ